MSVNKSASASMYTAILISAIAIWWTVLTLIEDRTSPVFLHSVSFSKDKAHPGETLWLTAKITRNRYCPGIVYEFWRHNGNVIQGSIRPASPSANIGSAQIRLQKTVPESATLGRWCYEPFVVYDCSDRQHVVASIPACLQITNG